MRVNPKINRHLIKVAFGSKGRQKWCVWKSPSGVTGDNLIRTRLAFIWISDNSCDINQSKNSDKNIYIRFLILECLKSTLADFA